MQSSSRLGKEKEKRREREVKLK